jgi:hypothetical protein
MPPNCPHAVFTPETSLAVGGQFLTAAQLPRSLEALSWQEKYPGISNEDLDDSIYKNLAEILRCHSITTDDEKAQIISSYSPAPLPKAIRQVNTEARKDFHEAFKKLCKSVTKKIA